MQTQRYEYDAFISHAVEDKLAIANELSRRLEDSGLKIWYSGRELSVGDSIDDTIHEGLSNSRFGIVILSKNYLEKSWTMRELDAFMYMEGSEEKKKVLPVLYEVTVEEVAAKHLKLADKFALKSERGLDYVVEGLLRVIQKTRTDTRKRERSGFYKRLAFWVGSLLLAALLAMGGFSVYQSSNPSPDQELIRQTIQNRIDEFTSKINLEHSTTMQVEKGKSVAMGSLDSLIMSYRSLDAKYRNEYLVTNGYTFTKSKKNVEALLQADLDTMTPANGYQMNSAKGYRFLDQQKDGYLIARYCLLNDEPVAFEIEKIQQVDPYLWHVTVSYTNNIRQINVTLRFPQSDNVKKYEVKLNALLPQETYTFQKERGEWVFTTIE